MKKVLLFLFLILGTISTAFAEEKTYRNGEVTAYLSGNRAEIVDNTNNVCIIVSVSRTKSLTGEWLYEFACNNKTTKRLTKLALHGAIAAGISAVASPATTAAISSVVNVVADDIYDEICEYYKE
ncbi:MAG: hypothetical protein K2H48_07245 [Duncaniella sp.]|nr:hypothetical protein [Duncaniella sp.]